MAGSSTVLTDDSRLSRADRLYHRLEKMLALLGGIVIMLLVTPILVWNVYNARKEMR